MLHSTANTRASNVPAKGGLDGVLGECGLWSLHIDVDSPDASKQLEKIKIPCVHNGWAGQAGY